MNQVCVVAKRRSLILHMRARACARAPLAPLVQMSFSAANVFIEHHVEIYGRINARPRSITIDAALDPKSPRRQIEIDGHSCVKV
jgi:hypothetical protein